jgi:methionine biosynthesis protein MetW
MDNAPIHLRLDQRTIVDIIPPSSSVLDLGCGEGELLAALVREKQVKAQGIELDDAAILRCVERGLNVFHDDIDRGLSEYGDRSFDFVVLNQTFQQVKKPDQVMKEALRVGTRVIIGIPNFAYLSARCQIFFSGRVPVTPSLPYEWHNTPNLHFLSLLDFVDYCRKRHMRIESAFYFSPVKRVRLLPNLFAEVGIFLMSGNGLSE